MKAHGSDSCARPILSPWEAPLQGGGDDAREFRDRYLDEVNSGRFLPSGNGKYDVSRQLAAAPTPVAVPLLKAA